MKIYCLTLFPEMIMDCLNYSILKRAMNNGIIRVECINIRDYSCNKHKQVDDTPYGGGAGMVMAAPPIYNAYLSIKPILKEGTRVIYLSPQGKVFNQSMAEELSRQEDLVLLCGHYEGVDERIIEEIVTEEISVGDFIMTGGEIGAMAVIDSISRLVPGVLGKDESYRDESFSDGLLEYPHFTRPAEFMGRKVPEVLLSGHHKNIEKWRREKSVERTRLKRPELMERKEADND